jgi:glycosyltransferase involved in cell wall biosynthesis
MTYNQEKYIEDALKGFVRQKTNFPFCAIVVDDCSTDGNASIIKEYERRFPDIIKGIYLPKNMYGNPDKRKYIKPWEERAQYIAYCEGDDYWIDDYKLQMQVDFLDSHPEYTMYLHNALIRYQDSNKPDKLLSNFESGDFTTAKLFEKWQLPLASVVFRSSIYLSEEYKKLSKNVHGGFLLFLASTKIGKVYGLAECLSVYRKNLGGVSNKMSPSWCLQVECNYAKASEDGRAIDCMKKKATQRMATYMPRLLCQNQAQRILSVAGAA